MIQKPNIKANNFSFGPMSNLTKEKVEYIVIHHAAPARDIDQSAESIHNFHRNVRGWSGIAYHFVVRFDGTIEAGRPLDKIGGHAGAQVNAKSIGICVTGNLSIGKIENRPAQYNSLVHLVAWLLSEYPKAEIKYHNDFSKTECPGRNFPKTNFGKKVKDFIEANKPKPKQVFHRVIVDGRQVGSFTELDNAIRVARTELAKENVGKVEINKVVI